MLKQIVAVTGKRVQVRVVMEQHDHSDAIPVADEMEDFANQAIARRFPGVDTSNWHGTYRLGAAPMHIHGAWGTVHFLLRPG